MNTTIDRNTVTITADSEKQAMLIKELAEWLLSEYSPEKFRNLTEDDLIQLTQWGHSLDELEQIETSYKVTVYKHDGKRISAKKAKEILGNTEFLSGLSRSSFHWTAARENNGVTVSFDSRKLFR